MHGRRLPRPLLTALLTLAAALALPAVAGAAQKVITSIGPLTNIYVNDNLGCQFTHTGDIHGEFFSGTDPGSCGTQVKVNGVNGTFGNPVGIQLTPVSQTDVGGTGTAANPFRVLTVADVGTTGVRIAQVDSYVVGQEDYRTSVTVTNTTGAPVSGVLYHGADCYLGDSDQGYGFHDPATGGIYCTKQPDNEPADRLEGFVPLTAGATYFEGDYSSNYAQIQSGVPLPNTCGCASSVDNGASIAWSYLLAAGGSRTFQFATTSSPAGIVPDTTPPAVTVDQPAAGSTTPDATPTLGGHAGTDAGDQPGITIGVYAGATASGSPVQTLQATASGSTWSATVASPLAQGLYTAVATQSDDAGNVGLSDAHTFTVGSGADTTPPVVTLNQPAAGASLTDTTPRLAGNAGTAPGDSDQVAVELYDGASATGSTTWSGTAAVAGGSWSIDTTGLSYGRYTARAVQIDAAGNTGASAPVTFTVDPPAGADLQVSVTPTLPLLVGRPARYTVEIHNHGPADATGVRLAAHLPAGADLPAHEEFPPSAPACSRASLILTCFAGFLRSGETLSYAFVLTPRRAAAMDVTAVATAAQADPVTSTNTRRADTAAVRPPAIAKTVVAARVSGVVRVKRRGAKGFKRLTTESLIPVGSLVDATRGRVRLTSERTGAGKLQTADFYRGRFLVSQQRAQHGLTTLDLRGGAFQGCPKAGQARGGATVARKRRHRRRLWGSGHGRFRTRGRFGSATVRGTVWYTQDACRATYFKTRRGVVSVRNYVKKKTVKVPAGQSYYARAPRP